MLLFVILGCVFALLLCFIVMYFITDDVSVGTVRKFFVLASISFILMVTGISPNYECGECIVSVKDVSESQLLWHSYDTNMMYVNDGGKDSRILQATTKDPAIAKILKDSLGKNVKVTYRSWFSMSMRYGTLNEIISIEPIIGKVE